MSINQVVISTPSLSKVMPVIFFIAMPQLRLVPKRLLYSHYMTSDFPDFLALHLLILVLVLIITLTPLLLISLRRIT